MGHYICDTLGWRLPQHMHTLTPFNQFQDRKIGALCQDSHCTISHITGFERFSQSSHKMSAAHRSFTWGGRPTEGVRNIDPLNGVCVCGCATKMTMPGEHVYRGAAVLSIGGRLTRRNNTWTMTTRGSSTCAKISKNGHFRFSPPSGKHPPWPEWNLSPLA